MRARLRAGKARMRNYEHSCLLRIRAAYHGTPYPAAIEVRVASLDPPHRQFRYPSANPLTAAPAAAPRAAPPRLPAFRVDNP